MRLPLACAACVAFGCGGDAPRAGSRVAGDTAIAPGAQSADAGRATPPPAPADTARPRADIARTASPRAAARGDAPARVGSRGEMAGRPAAPGSGMAGEASPGAPLPGAVPPAATPAPVPPSSTPPPPDGDARSPSTARSHEASPEPLPVRPFAVGETLTYEVRFGPIALGRASMQVIGVEAVRGIPAYHTRFQVRGGNALYRVNDVYQSWIDLRTLASLRYWQDIDEGSYEPKRRYEIFPDRCAFVEAGKGEQPSVALPLDEGSFLYWLRTIPLEVGKTYSFDRYFRPDRNPVTIRVLRRERIRVPAGEFDAIVVQPTIRTRGLLSEGGRAEVWFAADSTRVMLQMKSRLSIGALSLHLRSIERGR